MIDKSISIDFKEYNSIEELESSDRELLEIAIQATDGSYAPYSKFYVGAAVRMSNGKIVKGSNQENAAYPSGLCAERTAIFSAHAHYPNESIVDIAVVVTDRNPDATVTMKKDFASPCGSCRQVMMESETRAEKPIRIIVGSANLIRIFPSALSIMPFAFDALNVR